MSPYELEGLSAAFLFQMDCFKLSLILDLSAGVGHLYRSVHILRPFDQVSGETTRSPTMHFIFAIISSTNNVKWILQKYTSPNLPT